MFRYILRKLHISHYKLPQAKPATSLLKCLKQAETVTDSFIGIVFHPRYTEKGYKKILKAITLWIKPHLFLIDIRK